MPPAPARSDRRSRSGGAPGEDGGDGLGPVVRHRRALARTRRASRRGRLTVGVLGGSISAARPGTRWPEEVWRWWQGAFPQLRLRVVNAALGATGSDLGVWRAAEVVGPAECDLVFVEYAVNDADVPSTQSGRSREGVLRQLLATGADVVLVHTYAPSMEADLQAGRVPASVAEFEALAAHYGVSSVWVGLAAWRQVRRGALPWVDWLPDGLHPEARGSWVYARAVTDFLADALAPAASPRRPAGSSLPARLDSACWERVSRAREQDMVGEGGWTWRHGEFSPGLTEVWHAMAPGARLRGRFHGRGLVLGFDFGHLAGEVRCRVDGGDWHRTERDCPAWCGDCGWVRLWLVADDLPPGEHHWELETLSAQRGGRWTSLTLLGLIGIIH
jgi:lysophospholipase L1-like esterase